MSSSFQIAAVPDPGAPRIFCAMAALSLHDTKIQKRLLAWFAREQRALPWRATRDPYRVWISEAMLQQTRVETVLGYYDRFLERFPTVIALAEAPLEDVLAQWSGLGYYRRARTLHAAARVVVAQHGGVFPDTHAALLGLPGIGPYTAGAVASIAFGEAAPLVDGNVARVFARLFAIRDAQDSRAFQLESWRLARALIGDKKSPGDWNQALMELGATVCMPRAPDCGRCPVREACRALHTNTVSDLPLPKSRARTVDVELLTLVVREGERVLVRERPEGGRMAGLFELPTIETSGHEHIAAREFGAGLKFAEIEPLGSVLHTITRHRIRARVAVGRLVLGTLEQTWRHLDPRLLATLPLTGMTKKIAARGWLAATSERAQR